MTMVIAFSWKDKIVVMADSRISKKKNDEVTEFIDDRIKIYPVDDRFVISNTGASKIWLENKGTYLDVNDVINYYIKINVQTFNKLSGESILKGLVQCWNNTLEHEGLLPNEYDVKFLVCIWEFSLYPRIYCYDSYENRIIEGSQVAGDEEAMYIIHPFVKTDLDDMTFQEVIQHFEVGYTLVMKSVETVGGKVKVYELNQTPSESKWVK
ncbi:hypothetical protein AB1K91_07130 [Terribacillus sp. 179-K 1B1 HS]|uniref:hypothetical protein n=1 Tax=Terribacillus sp. 179-K 1B1 HS TaxID=3142388 RepID=UPI0039A05EE4